MTVRLAPEWKTLGPFPAGMRETPYEHPDRLFESGSAYLSEPPRWTAIHKDDLAGVNLCYHSCTHHIAVRYPAIDWEQYRSTAGWAGLQWQSVVATDLNVASLLPSPLSSKHTSSVDSLVSIAVDLRGAAEFKLEPLDTRDHSETPSQWLKGDIYAPPVQPPVSNKLAVPHLLAVLPGRYRLYVRAVYEIRLFGAPKTGQSPDVNFSLSVTQHSPHEPGLVTLDPLYHVPDVVCTRFASGSKDGGVQYLSFGMANYHPTQWMRITKVALKLENSPLDASLVRDDQTLVPPLTTVKLDVKFKCEPPQPVQTHTKHLKLKVVKEWLRNPEASEAVTQAKEDGILPFRQAEDPRATEDCVYRYTFLCSGGVQSVMIKPPIQIAEPGDTTFGPAILALHGAGVEAASEMWTTAIRRQQRAWVVLPTGLTPWGLDWQQASQTNWLEAIQSDFTYPVFPSIQRKELSIPRQLIILGHSNGGQGTWHALALHRAMFLGAVIGAGYIKLAEYVPLTWRRLLHSLDASQSGILDSALSFTSNDFYASNMVGLPIMIKYGAEDSNVPPYHSRQMKALLDEWNTSSQIANANKLATLVEVPGEDHWFDGFLSADDVSKHIDSITEAYKQNPHPPPPSRFTVNCVIPHLTDGIFGFRIEETDVPGRMARLQVEFVDDGVRADGEAKQVRVAASVKTSNVRSFSCSKGEWLWLDRSRSQAQTAPHLTLVIDSRTCIQSDAASSASGSDKVTFTKEIPSSGFTATWRPLPSSAKPPRPLSPISTFLSPPPGEILDILVILPTLCASSARRTAFHSIARAWSQELLQYTSLSVRTVLDVDFHSEEGKEPSSFSSSFSSSQIPPNRYVVLGDASENHAWKTCPWLLPGIDFIAHPYPGQFDVRDATYSSAGMGLLYTLTPKPLPPQLPPPQSATTAASTSPRPLPTVLVLTGTDIDGILTASRLLPVRTGTGVPEWIVVDRVGGPRAAGWYDCEGRWGAEMSFLT